MFSFELAYAGVFRIVNVPKGKPASAGHDRVPAPVVPVLPARLSRPRFAMAAFPPLMLDPVDFVGLYRQNMERQAAEMQAAQIKPS